MDSETELTEDQVHEMRWVENPATKRPAKLNHTVELEADYSAWLAEKCQHQNVETICNILKNGTKQVREQCVQCGKPFGTPIPHTKIASIDSLRRGTVELQFEYDKERRNQLGEIKKKHLSIQFRPGWGSSEYQEYLKSDKWLQIGRAHV